MPLRLRRLRQTVSQGLYLRTRFPSNLRFPDGRVLVPLRLQRLRQTASQGLYVRTRFPSNLRFPDGRVLVPLRLRRLRQTISQGLYLRTRFPSNLKFPDGRVLVPLRLRRLLQTVSQGLYVRKKKKKFSGNDVIFYDVIFCDDVISGSAIFVRDTLALIIGPYRVREKAVTVISSPPVDPLRIFTGPNGDFDWTHLGL